MKRELRTIKQDEITAWLKEMHEPAFRSSQINEWLWEKAVDDISQMRNLPLLLREKLKKDFYLDSINIKNTLVSRDKTMKLAFKLNDNRYVEGVLIPAEKRVTACISTQVGCRMGCKFCATGKMGFGRNLHVGEIYLQAWKLNALSKEYFGKALSNIVVMGMGEPLDNFQSSTGALKKIIDKKGMGMSPRRITLSTVGLSPEIKKLADTGLDINLSVSLHAANDKLRRELIPIARKYDLDTLAESLQYYFQQTKKRISYEYILFKNINDSLLHAAELSSFTKITACKINLIEYNPVEGTGYDKSEKHDVQGFIRHLDNKNIIVKLRQSRGDDVDAGCGQLANKF
ncbi:MAG: 23S rRNA (adenine(2503)-C(2))-methyltransferase RlmN [Bacteroidales bacterium]